MFGYEQKDDSIPLSLYSRKTKLHRRQKIHVTNGKSPPALACHGVTIQNQANPGPLNDTWHEYKYIMNSLKHEVQSNETN